MKNNAKCFIKLDKGLYEEISYKELEERRKKSNEYKNKRFIYIHKMLMEVTNKEYIEYYKEIERNRYAEKVLRKLQTFSIEHIKSDTDFRDKEIIKDETIDTEDEIERKLELEQLQNALLSLTEDEYQIIKALFFEENTVRNYAQKIGIPFNTIQSRKKKILEKLKKILKN